MDQKLKNLLLEVWDAARKTHSEYDPKKHKTHETPFYKNLDEWLDTQKDTPPDFAPIKGWSTVDGKLFTLEIEA